MYKYSKLTIISMLLLNCIIYSQSNGIANGNIIYVSPIPNSQLNSSLTNIIIRTNNLLNIQSVNPDLIYAKGSKSGVHNGNVVVSDDGRTIIFKPYIKFSPAETVTVYIKQGLKNISGNSIGNYSFSFSISKQGIPLYSGIKTILEKEIKNSEENINSISKSNTILKQMQKVNDDSLNLPSDFPQLYISVLSNPSPGYLFMSNFDASAFDPSQQKLTQPYLMILNNSGRPFYYKRMSNFCIDFTLQPGGLITYFDSKVGYFYAMNSHFSIVDSFYCGNRYPTDFHELQILPNGHYLIIGDDYEVVDMSKIVTGGDTNAVVTGIIIQELDENKNVVFQWRSWDHYKITDATDDISLTDSIIDPIHTNAIEEDRDGNLLISDRHMDEITKIDRQTGDIIWRLGGKNNQFQFLNDDVGFSHQHDIRRLPNGDITLFDDGNLHWSQLSSRAVEYNLDENNKTTELVWQFKNIPDEYTDAMGNVQRLADGNTVIGWGTGGPAITEVTQQGLKELELSLPENVFNYRAFNFVLDSTYYKPFVPTLNYPKNNEQVPDTMITLQWSKNKFAQSFHLQLASDSSFNNIIFEDSSIVDTSITIDSLIEGTRYYWRVLSDNNTDSIGGYAGYSKTIYFATLLNSPKNLDVRTTSQANFLSWENFTNMGDSIVIERKGGSDTLDYKKITELPMDKEYFVDTKPDTVNIISNLYSYRIRAINRYSISSYVYSRSFVWNVTTEIHLTDGNLPTVYSLKQNYPNPFNPSTRIQYSIPQTSYVMLKVYDILGREVETLVNEQKPAGNYNFSFDGTSLASGIYFYKIQAGSYSSVKKMILLK
jgi:Arylsulfotransferase (ASST)/Secretion system C-terminal sorting domain/Bacterial Ig-like domain